jgi:hypothetical protein
MGCGRSLLCVGSGDAMIGAIVPILAALVSSLALAEPVTCSLWRGVRTCQGADGCVSHESA